MDEKVIISKRFQRQTYTLYNYLCKEFSPKTGYRLLERIEERIEFLIKNPEIGKPSQKKVNVRSILLIPHNRIYYRLHSSNITHHHNK